MLREPFLNAVNFEENYLIGFIIITHNYLINAKLRVWDWDSVSNKGVMNLIIYIIMTYACMHVGEKGEVYGFCIPSILSTSMRAACMRVRLPVTQPSVHRATSPCRDTGGLWNLNNIDWMIKILCVAQLKLTYALKRSVLQLSWLPWAKATIACAVRMVDFVVLVPSSESLSKTCWYTIEYTREYIYLSTFTKYKCGVGKLHTK